MENFLNWLKSTFQPHYRDEILTYLSQSSDLCDLENRIKYLTHRGGML